MSPAPLLLLNFALFATLVGIVGPLLLWRRPALGHQLGCVCSGLASTAALASALTVLLGAPTVQHTFWSLPPVGALTLRLDPLAAVFLALIGGLGAAVSVYAWSYVRPSAERKHAGLLAALVSGFLLAMGLVPLMDHAVGLLLAWELMALTSFFLVAFEHDKASTRQAATLYALLTHLGAGFLFAAFLLFGAQAHGFGFEALRQAAPLLPESARNTVFVLAFLGFGTKLGILPLHGWLVEAHPAAPSHVSALMSGAMIALGAYGLIRVPFDLLGGGPAWWGLLVLAGGALTAPVGALYAAVEPDLKRLLAYSSIEHMGIVLLGIGAALLFLAHQQGAFAALALVATLYHLLNHAAFKGLLFCGAGAIQRATHTVHLDRLGGLIKRMPTTAACVLVGTLAITAMPLLNGFVSEWLLYQALFNGLRTQQPPLVQLALPLAACALAFAGGLCFVAFIKAYAVGFLAHGRSPEASAAQEAPLTMRAGLVALALTCLALGLGAGWVLPALSHVASTLVGATPPTNAVWWGLTVSPSRQVLSPFGLWSLFLSALLLAGLLSWLAGARGRTRPAPGWGCGLPTAPRAPYTAQGYAQPLRTVFAKLMLVTRPEEAGASTLPLSPTPSVGYRLTLENWAVQRLYAPFVRRALALAHRASTLEGHGLHRQLAYVFLTLLLVLSALKVWG